ncbi:hypothetical protein [Sphingomonas sp. ID0503]|uniref:hypothetical protein n=1 Tax=Sphingomonas sp. ID0503 TaxID=3399691 RepID=UPI003AFA03F8
MKYTGTLATVAMLAASPVPAFAQDAQATYKAAGARASKPVATIAYGNDAAVDFIAANALIGG